MSAVVENIGTPDDPGSKAASDRNRAGVATAMTLLTDRVDGRWPAAVRTPLLRAGMSVFRHVTWATRKLQKTSFIHAAHWSYVDEIPSPLGPPVEHPLMLFESNFNNSWNDYVDVFSLRFEHEINFVLWASARFPGVRPTRRFKKYMEAHEYPADHYWSAYPAATATVIRASLELLDRTEHLRLVAPTSSADDFRTELAVVLGDRSVQANLAGQACVVPHGWDDVRQLVTGARNRAGSTAVYIGLLPVAASAVPEMQRRLGALDGAASPFAAVTGTHLARLVLLDGAPRQATHPLPPLLLVTSVFDGPGTAAYLDRLLDGHGVQEVLAGCQDWPATAEDQRRYLQDSRIDADFLFSAYPGVSVARIKAALAFRAGFLRLLADRRAHRHLGAAAGDGRADPTWPAEVHAAFLGLLAD